MDSSKDRCTPLSSIANNYDGNCVDYLNELACTICRPGFRFEGTECVACEKTGCYLCNRDEECLMC